MNKKVEKVIGKALAASLATGVVASVPVKAAELTVDQLYKNAYNATQKALSEKTQASINEARAAIKALPAKMDWAIGEFSKKVDTVQGPKLSAIVKAIKAAEKSLKQADADLAKSLIEAELPEKWRNAYSQAADIAQQAILKNVQTAVAKAKQTMNDADVAAAQALLDDVKASKRAAINSWATTVETSFKEVTSVVKIVSVEATGLKTLEVKFNKAIDTSKATITVKRDASAANVSKVEFSEDKKTATITLTTKITKADYTVSVAGLAAEAITSDKLSLEDEKVAKITIVSDVAVLGREEENEDGKDYYPTATVSYKVYNQYGEDITKTAPELDINATRSIVDYDATEGKITLTSKDDTDGYEEGDQIVLSIIETESKTYTSKTLTIAEEANVASIEITKLYNSDNSKLTVSSNATDFYLVVEAKDQYGNKLAADQIASGIHVSVSGDKYIDINGTEDDPKFTSLDINGDGVKEVVLQLAEPKAGLKEGTAMVSFISKHNGDTANFNIEVASNTYVDKITLSSPEIAVAGDDIEIPFTAFDKAGNAIVDIDVLRSTVDLESEIGDSKIYFQKDNTTGKVILVLDASSVDEADKISVSAEPNSDNATGRSSNLTLNVKDPSQFVAITGSTLPKTLAVGAGAGYGSVSVFTVYDQYDRAVDIRNYLGEKEGDYQVRLTSSDTSKLLVNKGGSDKGTFYLTKAESWTDTWQAIKSGSATVTATLCKVEKVNGTLTPVAVKKGESYSWTVKIYEKKDFVKYELVGGPAEYRPDGKSVSWFGVNGVLSTGATVGVPSDATLPDGTKVVYFTRFQHADDAKYDKGLKVSWGVDSDKDIDPTTTGDQSLADLMDANGISSTGSTLTVIAQGKDFTSTFSKSFKLVTTARKMDSLRLTDSDYNDSYVIKDMKKNKITVGINDIKSGSSINTSEVYKIASKVIKMTDQFGNGDYIPQVDGAGIDGVSVTFGNASADITKLVVGDTFDLTVVTKTGKSIVLHVTVKDDTIKPGTISNNAKVEVPGVTIPATTVVDGKITANLTSVADATQVKTVKVTQASLANTTLSTISLSGNGATIPLHNYNVSFDGNGVANINITDAIRAYGSVDNGNNGVSIEKLQSLFGSSVTISGKVNDGQAVTIVLQLN